MRTTTIIDVEEWDAIVKKEYNKPYSFQQQDGCKDRSTVYFSVPDEDWLEFENDTIPEIVNGEEMGVSFAAWLARDPLQPIENQKHDYELRLWWERNFYPGLQSIANDLYKKGILSAGDYGIKIDW